MHQQSLLILLLACGFVTSAPAQIVQEWTHAADIGEASAAIAMGDQFMFVVDNEDEYIRLYNRRPGVGCSAPVSKFYARPFLSLSSSNPEADLEAGVKVVDGRGTHLYWLGSHSNSKSGNPRPNRNRLFSCLVTGDGSVAAPFNLSFEGRYDSLRDDLKSWDASNKHGKGPNYYGFAVSMASGMLPTWIDGFNMEGLVMAPDGVTAYLAFRTPLVNASGATTSPAQRTNALIVPLLNLPELVAGSPTPGPGVAKFGQPFTLPLGARGIRSIDSSHPGHYLITAGPAEDTSNPPVAPLNFRLFTWTGNPADAPVEQPTDFPFGYNPEGAILPPGPIAGGAVAQFVSDDSGGCFRSFTAPVGPQRSPVPPVLQSVRLANGQYEVLIQGEAGFDYTVEKSINLSDWQPIATLRSPAMPYLFLDPAGGRLPACFFRVRLGQ